MEEGKKEKKHMYFFMANVCSALLLTMTKNISYTNNPSHLMLLTFQYQLYNPQSIQKPFLGFFIITATTKDTCPLGERHLNHVII